MKEKTIKIYTFDELLPKVQEKVIERFRETISYDFSDWILEDANTVGVKITAFDIYEKVCEIEFRHSDIATAEAITKEHGESCETYKAAKEYLNAITENTPEEEEQKLTDRFKKSIEKEYLRMLTAEYDYTQSDEHIIEFIKDNEYYFRENGTIEAE